MFNLENKIILVFGGRGYLGREFCEALRSQNATVISADLPVLSKASKKSAFDSSFDDIEQEDVDVKSRASILSVVSKVIKRHGKIDTFIYSVTSKPNDFYLPFTECSLEGWKSVVDTELDGLFMSAQEVGKFMEKESAGSMIFISSIYGVVGNDQRIYKNSNLANLYADQERSDKQIYSHSVYPVVKGGIISLARYLAAYWGEKNIRVNCVSPGGIYHKGENKEFLKKYSERVPLGRKADSGEVSSSVVYLSADESNYITGQNFIIDGGWTAW